MYSVQHNFEFAAFAREHAIFGHEILTDTGPTTTQRYSALIPMGAAATLTYFNTIDGGDVSAQEFPENFFISGHIRDVTVVGTVFAIKADPNISDKNEPA